MGNFAVKISNNAPSPVFFDGQFVSQHSVYPPYPPYNVSLNLSPQETRSESVGSDVLKVISINGFVCTNGEHEEKIKSKRISKVVIHDHQESKGSIKCSDNIWIDVTYVVNPMLSVGWRTAL